METKFIKETDGVALSDLGAREQQLKTADQSIDQMLSGKPAAAQASSGSLNVLGNPILVAAEVGFTAMGYPGVAASIFAGEVMAEMGGSSRQKKARANSIFMTGTPAAGAQATHRKAKMDIMRPGQRSSGARDIFGNVQLAGKSLTDYAPKGMKLDRKAIEQAMDTQREIRLSLANVEKSQRNPSTERILDDILKAKPGAEDHGRNNAAVVEVLVKNTADDKAAAPIARTLH